MVKVYFNNLTKRMLNGIRVSSKEEPEKRIYKYFKDINVLSIPYHWSYKLDDITIGKRKNRTIQRRNQLSTRCRTVSYTHLTLPTIGG